VFKQLVADDGNQSLSNGAAPVWFYAQLFSGENRTGKCRVDQGGGYNRTLTSRFDVHEVLNYSYQRVERIHSKCWGNPSAI
jgi:hypothetical protein